MDSSSRKRILSVPRPQKELRFDGSLTLERLEQTFQDRMDFAKHPASLGKGGAYMLALCYLSGMVKMERVSDCVLWPLARDEALVRCGTSWQAMDRMKDGALYNSNAEERTRLDTAVFDSVNGCCLLLFPGESSVLSLNVGTEEKRSISSPSDETVLRGSRDAFVESLRTSTSIVRRHLEAPELRIREQVVGRQLIMSVDTPCIEGLTNPHLVGQVATQLASINIDTVLATGSIEKYIVPAARTTFPLAQYTERSDRFCAGLVEGRVGILINGPPLDYLTPGVLESFLQVSQDKSGSWLLISTLALLCYLRMLSTLFLPTLYMAAVTFHQEMILVRLALSIIAVEWNIPFCFVFEVIVLLLVFEVFQEVGPRLPQSTGQAVSITSGLVVGSAAVEAKIISPTVLIVVAIAGITGYTIPPQEVAGVLRVWRFLLVLLASAVGLSDVVASLSVLVIHLTGIESFGVSYLIPLASNAGEQVGGYAVFRQSLPRVEQRSAALEIRNRRNQK